MLQSAHDWYIRGFAVHSLVLQRKHIDWSIQIMLTGKSSVFGGKIIRLRALNDVRPQYDVKYVTLVQRCGALNLVNVGFGLVYFALVGFMN